MRLMLLLLISYVLSISFERQDHVCKENDQSVKSFVFTQKLHTNFVENKNKHNHSDYQIVVLFSAAEEDGHEESTMLKFGNLATLKSIFPHKYYPRKQFQLRKIGGIKSASLHTKREVSLYIRNCSYLI